MLIEPTETETKGTLDKFITVMTHIASEVRAGNRDQFHHYPQSAPRRRLDEVKAARHPVLRWSSDQA